MYPQIFPMYRIDIKFYFCFLSVSISIFFNLPQKTKYSDYLLFILSVICLVYTTACDSNTKCLFYHELSVNLFCLPKREVED